MRDEASPKKKERAQNKNLSKTGAPKVSSERGLTLKQALFCLEYVANDGKGTEAALKAGYSEETAHSIATENLQKPVIQSRLKSLQKNRMARLESDADWIIKELKLTVKQARKAGDNAGVNRALELIGKAQGLFAPDGAKFDAQINIKMNFPPKEPIDRAALVELDPDDDRHEQPFSGGPGQQSEHKLPDSIARLADLPPDAK